MPPAPAPPARRRRRWLSLSPTLARDRCLDRTFYSAGLRPTAVILADGATLNLWVPHRPSPARRTLLLLHGFGARATWQWGPFLRPLIAAGFDLYIPDLLFFGRSRSPSPFRSDEYQASCVLAAMDAVLGPAATFGVAGISYGGFVAYRIAAMRPLGVDRVIIVSAGVCLEQKDLAEGLFAVADIDEAASLLLPRRPEELKRLVNLTFCRPPPVLPLCIIRDYIEHMCSENIREKTELLYALIDGRKLSDLPHITQPTLIVWGDQDRVFPLELAHRLKRLLGDNAQLVVMKNVGHSINRERPRELCMLLRNYFVDFSVKYHDGHKGPWKRMWKKFAGPSLKRVDSGRPLL